MRFSPILDARGQRIVVGDALKEDVTWLRDQLRQRGIAPNPSSSVAQWLRQTEELAENYAGKQEKDETVLRERMRDSLELQVFLAGLRRTHPAAQEALLGKLSVFCGPDVSQIRPTRRPRTGERDLAWELLCGAVVGAFDPSFMFDEPDIVCSVGDYRWGIACKMSYSKNPGQVVKQIVGGADQIEASGVDEGVVLVNVTEHINHHRYAQQRESDEAQAVQGAQMATIEREVISIASTVSGPLERRLRLSSNWVEKRLRLRGVWFWGGTNASGPGYASATFGFAALGQAKLQGPELDLARAFAGSLNRVYSGRII